MTKTHGMSGTTTYNCWKEMKRRCLNPNDHDYKNYGGRGITVSPAWLMFEGFLADMGVRPKGRSIDRINNDESYEPGNCRWATPTQQQRNKGLTSTNTSGVAGVYWSKKNKKWYAQITVKYKSIHLGYFTSLENAVAARKQGETDYWGKAT